MLLVGLGNPGIRYTSTRHNIGFRVIDEWVNELNAEEVPMKFESQWFECIKDDKKIRLIKPQTYMNDSGFAVKRFAQYFNIPLNQIVVVCDDMDIEFGRFRFRSKGSAGTHNGLKSLIKECGGAEFNRLRFGIGPKPDNLDAAQFVLQSFNRHEEAIIPTHMSLIRKSLPSILSEKWEQVMQALNGRAV